MWRYGLFLLLATTGVAGEPIFDGIDYEKPDRYLAIRPTLGDEAAIARQARELVGKSFNTDYDQYLPQAKGHILLIETQNGRPIIDRSTLERHFPQASAGVKTGSITIADTRIQFVDFGKLLTVAPALPSAADPN